MEYFAPCWIALSHLFPKTPSSGLVKKYTQDIDVRIAICDSVGKTASQKGVDPILAIAIAFAETGFSDATSKKNAKGPLGVVARYHCPKNEDLDTCNYLEAGIQAIQTCLDMSDYDYCSALALYNRGVSGKCEKGRSEYAYAQYVMDIYSQICAATDECHVC